MLLVIQLVVLVLFFGATGFLAMSMMPAIRKEFPDILERVLLSLFSGMGLYILLFIVLNAIFQIPITKLSVYGSFLVLCLLSFVCLRTRHIPLAISLKRRDILVAVLLAALFALALKVRLINTLYYPDHLVDADPYRHYIRSKALLQTGMLSKWEPLIMGDVPVLFPQGCYIFVTIVSLVSGLDLFSIWRYGSIVIGVLGILAFYLFVRHIFQQKEPVALTAAAFLALSPIHVFRTDIGFSEPYALLFVPLAFLFLLLFVREAKFAYACLFGLSFTAAAASNLLVGALLAPLLLVYGLYLLLARRNMRICAGLALAFIVFALLLLVWSQTYLGVPLLRGGSALSSETVELLDQERPEIQLVLFIIRWIGLATALPALVGLVIFLFVPWILYTGERGSAAGFASDLKTQNMFFIVFFFLYFFLAYFAHRGDFVLPAARIYRYLTLPSYCLSLFAALGCIGLVEVLSGLVRRYASRKRMYAVVRNAGYALLTLFLAASLYRARPETFWLMGPTQEEFAACDWIKGNLPEEAIFVTHWYTGDFVRSLTDRRIVISPRHRTQVAEEVRMTEVHVPLLESPADMVRFAREQADPVYFFKSQYGPWFDVDSDSCFSRVYATDRRSKKPVAIYRIE